MAHIERWYDKDVDLAQLFSLLENIKPVNRKIVAGEILQIIFRELNIDKNKEVMSLNNLTYEQNKRWYDTDIDVQSCIEIIKDLSPEYRHELILRIIEDLEQIYIKGI